MKKLILMTAILVLTACGSNQPGQRSASAPVKVQPPASDYAKDLTFPKKVYAMEYVSQHKYDDPIYGIQLRYAHDFSSSDILDVYVYPIPAAEWEETLPLLREETKQVLAEIKMAVEQKHYQAATPGEIQEIELAGQKGVKTPLDLIINDGTPYQSFVYLFAQEDKFIKLRFSFLKGNGEGLPNGDSLAEELIAKISVPKESAYMHALREEHKKQQAQQLMQLLMQALEKQETE